MNPLSVTLLVMAKDKALGSGREGKVRTVTPPVRLPQLLLPIHGLDIKELAAELLRCFQKKRNIIPA